MPTPQSPTHTATPWRRGPFGGIYPKELNGPLIGGCHDTKGVPMDNWNADEKFIVESVNAYAALQAENAELREALKNLHHELEIATGMDWKINANLAMARRHAFEVINK